MEMKRTREQLFMNISFQESHSSNLFALEGIGFVQSPWNNCGMGKDGREYRTHGDEHPAKCFRAHNQYKGVHSVARE